MSVRPDAVVRTTRPDDFPGIIELCRDVYRGSAPWRPEQLESHLRVFPEGQFVAADRRTGRVLGMAASLVILWADYDITQTWRDFTDDGYFTNHDPNGHTLYGAEVLVRPELQRRGVGGQLYRARFDLVRELGLYRIRAAARLRGYAPHAKTMSAAEYVVRVRQGTLKDPTLSFQIQNGFEVIAVVDGYLRHDPESLGHAAVIEWLNPDAVQRGAVQPHRPFTPGAPAGDA
jgi:GNAT superfamily N-acetyltransferase